MVSENQIGNNRNCEYNIGNTFSGVIHDDFRIINAKLNVSYKIIILDKYKRSSDEKFSCTGIIVENVMHKKNYFVSKFLRICNELRVPQYNPLRSPKIIHNLINSVMPSAIILITERKDYSYHDLPGYSIKFTNHGFGGFYMNFTYSGELSGMSVYPTCGYKMDISQMDWPALQA